MALIAAHLVLAQLTLLLAVAFVVVSKASRWRLWWLAAPAVAGAMWTLVTGPAAAAAGFAAGPSQILGHLGAYGPLHIQSAFAGAGRWLPLQFPLALAAASAEAAAAGWLDWLHTDEWAVRPPRPGLAAALRRAVTARAIRGGAVVTRNGATFGVVPATGARAWISWAEAADGILLAGTAGRDITSTGFQVVHAALRLRKPVIVLDLTGDPAMGSALATACSAAGTPLRTFGVTGGCYEPFRAADPSRRTELTLALLGDHAGGAEPCLRTAFELMTAVPADARTAVLDDAAHLLNPMAAHARLALVPADGPVTGRLAERVRAAARLAQAEPETITTVARQLAEVRGSPAGGWLRPGGAGQPDIDLARVIRDRSAALFRPESPGLARLIVADLLALGDDLRRLDVDGDTVVAVCGCEKLPAGTVARLVDSGATAGLSVLATTTSGTAAAGLSEVFGTLVIHRLAPADAASGPDDQPSASAILAARTGIRLVPADLAVDSRPVTGAHVPTAATLGLVPQPAVPVRTLLSLGTAQFTVAAGGPRPRLVTLARTVPARLPHPAVAGSSPAETRAIARLRAAVARSGARASGASASGASASGAPVSGASASGAPAEAEGAL